MNTPDGPVTIHHDDPDDSPEEKAAREARDKRLVAMAELETRKVGEGSYWPFRKLPAEFQDKLRLAYPDGFVAMPGEEPWQAYLLAWAMHKDGEALLHTSYVAVPELSIHDANAELANKGGVYPRSLAKWIRNGLSILEEDRKRPAELAKEPQHPSSTPTPPRKVAPKPNAVAKTVLRNEDDLETTVREDAKKALAGRTSLYDFLAGLGTLIQRNEKRDHKRILEAAYHDDKVSRRALNRALDGSDMYTAYLQAFLPPEEWRSKPNDDEADKKRKHAFGQQIGNYRKALEALIKNFVPAEYRKALDKHGERGLGNMLKAASQTAKPADDKQRKVSTFRHFLWSLPKAERESVLATIATEPENDPPKSRKRGTSKGRATSGKGGNVVGMREARGETALRLLPLFKYAGGKRDMLSSYAPSIPATIKRYVEPFFGGGAMLLWVLQNRTPERCIINDDQPDLMEMYRAIQSQYPDFLGHCEAIDGRYATLKTEKERKKLFYVLRRHYNRHYAAMSMAERAAHHFFIRCCCYNGVTQTTKEAQGRLATAAGHMKREGSFYDRATLDGWHKALERCEILSGDWRDAILPI